MAGRDQRMANLLLRYIAPFSGLRRLPIIGDLLSLASRRLVPPNILVWVQIQQGPAMGLWISVNPRTGSAVQQGLNEPAVQQALERYLRPGMTFYDLGANIGFFSLMAARIVGPSGRVVSFEADPENVARLRENIAYNKFDNTVVEQKAVWSETKTVMFTRVDVSTSPDRGLGHVSVGETSGAATIAIDAISLDQFVLSHVPPDFLKCDVEGSEVAVFEGAQRLLREKRPILLFEMHSIENHQFLDEKFRKIGYTCNYLDANHVLALP